MDGHFVPNLTIGPLVVEAARRSTSLPLDVHLMVEDADSLLEEFVEAGAGILTVHQEACRHLQRTLAEIRRLGARAGVALNPATPVDSVKHVAPDIDLLLVMTVNPGFGGQKMIPACIDKVREARALLSEWGCSAEIEVDGGINPATVGQLVAAGAEVIVAGSAVFGAGSVAGNVRALREAAEAIAVS
jgi:ribulose-phosphate 3-epimerase